MKKRIIVTLGLLLTAALSATLLLGCSGGSGGSGSSSASDNSTTSKKFIVGFDQSFPPYGYVGDDGKFTGFDLDLAAEVAKRNGWEVEYKPINWDNKDQELNSGSIDCIWNGFTMEGRETGYEWTEAYMDNSQVIVVKKDSGITKLSDLSGKTVMAQVDSAALHLLETDGDQAALAKTFKNLQQVADYQSAFLELEQGSVDAVALDLPVAKFQISGKESTYLVLEADPLSVEHYVVGFKLGNTELRDTVQKTLKEMITDGTVEKLCKKYADQGIDFKSWCMEK
ncbi:MAG TPA: ABC transporter substrate-binding protein [Coriobacteriia bacterium]|nr:ABC transporter substrate-binding protein [Coriobacteriia bacterium]